MKVRIEMEDFRARQAWLELLEAAPLESLELTDGGRPVALPEGLAERWRFTGLSNRAFLREADAYLRSGDGLQALREYLGPVPGGHAREAPAVAGAAAEGDAP